MISQDLNNYLVLAKKFCPQSPVQKNQNYKEAAKQIIINLHVLDIYIDEITSNNRGILDSENIIDILVSIQNIHLHLLTELPHYKSVNFSMYIRSMSEDALKMIHYYLYKDFSCTLTRSFRNLRCEIKEHEFYADNEHVKRQIDFLLSSYGSGSIEIHKIFSNGELTSSLEALWSSPPPRSFHKMKDFMKNFRRSLLTILNSIYDLNERNLTLASKKNLINYLSSKEFQNIFEP